MTDERSDEQVERAALHALGALDGAEHVAIERLLEDEGAAAQRARADLASFQRVAAQIGAAAPPVAPPAALKAKVMARIQDETQSAADAPEGFTFIRSAEGTWVEPLPGMKLKVLYVDPITQRTTAICKFAPGYRHAPHRHAQVEELFILEGGCVCEGVALFPGDYHRSDADSVHSETSTDDGCTLLIMFSPKNEVVGGLGARISSATVSFLFRLSGFLARLAQRFATRR